MYKWSVHYIVPESTWLPLPRSTFTKARSEQKMEYCCYICAEGTQSPVFKRPCRQWITFHPTAFSRRWNIETSHYSIIISMEMFWCAIFFISPQFRSLHLRRAMPYTVSNHPQSLFIWLVSRTFYLDSLFLGLLLYRRDSCKNALPNTATLISPYQQLHIIHLVIICNYFHLGQTLLISHDLEWLLGFCIAWTFILRNINM